MNNNQDLNFLQFLQTFRRGELIDDCNQKLNELMEALSTSDKGGSLTLKFDFKHNKAGQLEITPNATIKKPIKNVPPGVYFISDDTRLTRRDPRQMDIEDEIDRRRAMDA